MAFLEALRLPCELRSQSRLRYIADRVLLSSSDMFQKNKDETLDELSALGLRHVGGKEPFKG